jgi:hypothetical protein
MFRGAAALAEAVDDCEVAATGEAIVEARRLLDRLQAKVAAAEVEFVRCGGHEVEGHANYGSFMRARCGVSTSESRRIAVRAKKLGRWPEVLDAWQAGEVTGAKVEMMSAVVPDRHVDRFSIATTEALVWLPWVTVDDTRRKVASGSPLLTTPCRAKRSKPVPSRSKRCRSARWRRRGSSTTASR